MIFRNNQNMEDITRHSYKGIVLSPGPGLPSDSGNLMEVLHYYYKKLPILGICLGHQAIGQYFNAKIVKANKPMHGKISELNLHDDYIFNGFPRQIRTVRYHSLVLDQLPDTLDIIAGTRDEEIMAIRHKALNIRGLQFHPEAILTDYGMEMIRNWVTHNKI